MSVIDPTLCNSPDDLSWWIRYAAELYADEREGVGVVMRKANGRANPAGVADSIRALRSEFPAHLIAERDDQDTLTYCDDGCTSNAVGPKTDNVADVTCLACLNAAHAYASSLAAGCAARVAAMSPVVTFGSEFKP